MQLILLASQHENGAAVLKLSEWVQYNPMSSLTEETDRGGRWESGGEQEDASEEIKCKKDSALS